MTPRHSRTGWFEHDRFGMFVHFGPYSVAGRHEWVMNYEELTVADYARYVRFFDPDLFDARAITRTAREAGARYVVLTTKHHDGFCLWKTGQGEYSSWATIGRDLVGEFVDAARAEGLRVGFYHSLLDWHHPDYTIDRHHPQRRAADVAARNARRDWGRYRDYLHAQVRELLTGYGTIDYLFFDFTEPAAENGLPGKSADDWDAERLLALCRELQPDMLVNDRLGIPADLVTPEQYQPLRPLERDGERVLWEACQTVNGSWGYHRDNLDFKSPELLVSMLVDTVSKGGNLLLNVGPTGRGEIAPRDRAIFESIGGWMRHHCVSVYGAGPSAFTPPPHAVYTQRADRLYVHVHTWPFGHLHLPGLAGRIRFARLLHDGSEVLFTQIPADQQANTMTPAGPPPGTATLLMPVQRPDVLLPVVELVLEEP
ncbi:alpha-L-fucosidase [Streptosporangium becharense]|uniref:alpha-L-fucosidase n=1 Tax=Streptosporangium becharense TaxID=1816182 RepID=A0A7W9ILV2_9ACTN|nr:alpha-L-fucosidase [Streptosporangium becharense]MBB2910279.1 alpha-L-fucosidase [Streptosporangium becharense]MBB5823022.1 alpha-L-fucosidase [Streptosporangium becharense]